MSIAVFDTSNSMPRSVECDEYLSSDEIWWQDHQVWLEQCGYMLRPRYRPGWVPSWVGTKRTQYMCEDGQDAERGQVLDATRLVDGAIVVLKKVMVSRFPHEIEISRFLSSPALAKDPRNHCVPVYDVLSVPDNDDLKLLVMPLLHEFYSPKFLIVGEAVECCRQIIEGMQFMHSHRVAHRDCGLLNIMMDPKPLFPKLFHFATPWLNTDISGRAKHYTRTSSPTKYFYIDFGISRKFDPAKGSPRAWPIRGADKTVPEFAKSTDPCDPFPTDIYYLGNTIRTAFLQEYRGLEFMKPLVDDMVQDDPSKRPTIDDVAARFDILLGSLWWWKLRSRLRRWNEHWIERPFRVCAHIFRTVYYIITCTPALPRP